jgi:hypothetical protein
MNTTRKVFLMDKVYLDENIFYIENFISEKDILALHDAIKSDSYIEDNGHISHVSLNIRQSNLTNIWNRYLSDLDDLFNNETETLIRPYTDFVSLIKYRNFDFSSSNFPEEFLSSNYTMSPHADDNSYDLSEKDFNERKSFVSKGIVIFINDDFEGGEVVYVNKDISIKPKAGTLVCHPGTKEYTHAVNKFYNGDRIIASMFVHKDIV